MEFSKKAKEHIHACRFCWMCHHVCPIGNATGLERNTAHARAISLSMVVKNAIDFSSDVIDNVYECALCGGCMTDCVTGWDPVMFTKEARLNAALDGKLPEYITKLVTNLQEKGNIYGKDIEISEIKGRDTLFFLGEDTRANGIPEKAIELLNKAGVDFTVLKDEPNSGYSMDFMIGAAAETKAIMENCSKILNNYKKVVCYDPADAKVMLREYKEWGIELNAEVVTFTSFVSGLIKEGKLNPSKKDYIFTPQESPLLARDLEETEAVRSILANCGEIKEMLNCKEYTMLAGNLIMNEYIPHVMKLVAKKRWENAKAIGAKTLVTVSPAEYILLSENNTENIELLKLEEAVLKCL